MTSQRGNEPTNQRIAALISCLACLAAGFGIARAGETVDALLARGDAMIQPNGDYVASLQRAAEVYRRAAELDPKDPRPEVRLARADLELGDCLPRGRDLPWYQRGEKAAARALQLDERSADANYYYAANRGNALEQLPFWRLSPGMLSDIESHLKRAIELDPHHARALHMMGMFLNSVPGPLRLLLSGKKSEAEGYLTRAVAADPSSALARRDLAIFYRDTGRPEKAVEQLRAILALTRPSEPWKYAHHIRPEAEALLRRLAPTATP